MERAIISFSFDDGRMDNYTIAYPIMKKLGIPATFNITTGFVEGKFEDGRLTHAKPMIMDMVRELYYDPEFEIAGHGYWHENSLDDILKGIKCLIEEIGVKNLDTQIGFASPGTSLDLNYYQTIKNELNNHNICYIRLSKRYLSYPLLKVLCRKLNRFFHWPYMFKLAYQDTLMDGVHDNLLYSIPVMASTTVKEVKALINEAVKEKKACILMWHSIVHKNDVRDNFDYDVRKFEEICVWLKELQDQ